MGGIQSGKAPPLQGCGQTVDMIIGTAAKESPGLEPSLPMPAPGWPPKILYSRIASWLASIQIWNLIDWFLLFQSHCTDGRLHPPSQIIPRPALRADENDPVALFLSQKGAVKSKSVAALGADPEFLCRLDFCDLQRSFHAPLLSLKPNYLSSGPSSSGAAEPASSSIYLPQ